MRLALTLLLFIIGGLAGAGSPEIALGATFVVTITTDAVDSNPGDGVCASAAGECTLRAAIQETNALPGVHAIALYPLTYTLAIPGEVEDAAATGDLDITDDLKLIGTRTCFFVPPNTSSCVVSTIDGGGLDRVLHIAGDSEVDLYELEIRNGSVVTGPGGYGGGIQNDGHVQLFDGIVAQNIAVAGGGISNSGTAIIERTAIEDNQAPVYGGGLLNESGGNLTLRDSSVRGNRVITGNGGGLTNVGTLLVENSAITGNVASHEGGGVENYSGYFATIRNSTISGNSASRGGALFNNGPGTPPRVLGIPPPPPGETYLTNVTIAQNVGQQAIMTNGIVTVQNTIVAGVAGYLGCNSPVTSLGHNLTTDQSCGLNSTDDIHVADPLLGPLAANGGATQTHALPFGSPAIDAADDAACPGTDQRGLPRPSDGNGDGIAACDIGAYELQAPLPATPTTSPVPTSTPAALPDSGGIAPPASSTSFGVVAVAVVCVITCVGTLLVLRRRWR